MSPGSPRVRDGDRVATVSDALMFVRGMIAEAEEGFLSIDDLRDLETMLSGIKTGGQRVMVKGAGSRRARSTSSKKRKKSAWNLFVADEMPKVLKKHPRFTPQRAMKEVSRRWRSSTKNPNRRKRR